MNHFLANHIGITQTAAEQPIKNQVQRLVNQRFSVPCDWVFFHQQNTRLVLCTFSVFTVAGFSGMLLDVPIVRLFEKIALPRLLRGFPQLDNFNAGSD